MPFKTRPPKPESRSRSGAAMTETVLVLPFLVFILLLVFYFGQGVVRVQHAHVLDRYEAWRTAAATGVPAPAASQGVVNPQMNQTFFADKAATLQYTRSDYFPDDARNSLTNSARNVSADTGNLVDQAFQNFPRGVTARFTTTFTNTVTLWNRLEHPIEQQSTRLDGDWKFANNWQLTPATNLWGPADGGPWMLPTVCDVFLADLDNSLSNMVNQGNTIASLIHDVYLSKPAYVGPTITLPTP